MINAGCKAMVIEASSIGLKHSRLAGMTFDVGIFTNFSDDHIGGVEHKDLAEYLYCKSLLFRQCKFAAANIDDPAWKDITKDFKGSVLTYGFADNADLKGKNAHLLSENGFVGVHFETEGIKNLSVDVDIPGKFNAYNALAAISAVSFFNEIEDQMIIDALKVAKVKGRVERVPVPYTTHSSSTTHTTHFQWKMYLKHFVSTIRTDLLQCSVQAATVRRFAVMKWAKPRADFQTFRL